MLTLKNISLIATTGLMLLLAGALLLVPDIFVSGYTVSQRLWSQCVLGIGLLVFILFRKSNIELPSLRYIMLVLAWGCYHWARGNWSFENLVNILTGFIAFFLFYQYWREVPRKDVTFGVFCCLGLILSIWGVGQYLEWLPKKHDVFTMTGPFNNPAGISASIALLFPFSLYFCSKLKGKARWAGSLVPLLMAGTVILCGARAAILAVALTIIFFTIHLLKKRNWIELSFFHYSIIALSCFLLLGSLYLVKKDSADGRLLIWHCSGQLVKQAPLFGHGYSGFKARYMTEQANYFSRHPESKFAMLADNTGHPFNEFVKETVEYGAVGLLLSTILVVLPLYRSRRRRSLEVVIVRLSLLSIGICSLFSYPLYYPFIWLMVILLLVYLVAEQEISMCGIRISYINKSLIGVISIFILSITLHQFDSGYKWNNIARASLSGFTDEMLPEYHKLYSGSYLKKNALFLYNYASELNYTGEYNKSNIILLECRNYMNDVDIQMLMANNFKNLNEADSAIQSLTLTSQMIPVKFFPLYRLAKLYEKNDEIVKAKEIAERIIRKEIKIPSVKITVMKDEMEDLIAKHQTNEYR